jgi:hypothetical protein
MRIRWTTRIAMAAGLLTLVAGIATGGGPAHAAARPAASAVATTEAAVGRSAAWAAPPPVAIPAIRVSRPAAVAILVVQRMRIPSPSAPPPARRSAPGVVPAPPAARR